MNEWRRFTNGWPGDEMARRFAGTADREQFYASGKQAAQDIDAALGVKGRDLASFTSILDFGCGCGRILMWFGPLSKTVPVHGVEIDEEAARWAQHHIPYATISSIKPEPPIDYADDFFDLVYCQDFFYRADDETAKSWLAELQRVTRPGGILVLAARGDFLNSLLSQRWSGLSLAAHLQRALLGKFDLVVLDRIANERRDDSIAS